GDVRVGAPDVHAVCPDPHEPQPLEPHVAGAVEDGYCGPLTVGAPLRAAAVDREVGDPDSLSPRDDQRPVARPRPRRDDRARAGTDEARAAPDPQLIDLVSAGREPNRHAATAELLAG